MPRRVKCRRVAHIPRASCFKPAGIPACELEEVVLKLEEAEALRLKDLLGYDQFECAEQMGVSRTTFQRILVEAHRKVADAIINSKALLLEGGNYKLHEVESEEGFDDPKYNAAEDADL
ncbi:Predicted DNA-binding protein, UPF0251 family [Thermosyntropha lipolytica DSM 11003]|uniref:UPF0251 protein SAMN02745221_01477 n=1 Tax=Thermosyntropha lipolytica DSM 11003 TaxID=1123382 RepID=A0A1M5PI14_9FIRM|nr:DUF134 domain-containing protein [Thermosyntropha lipolytica]SHH01415.1 Predicted DNA-binding protein, UPF0251 family [Thermosyntropha lipolytica DSM 11003]